MAGPKLTPQQQRDRRAKIMAGVLGVVFVGVLGLQLPKLMKGGGGGGSTTDAAVTTPAPSSSAALAGIAISSTQLQSFTRFAPKNPFHAHVTDTTTSSTTTAASPPPAPKPKPKPTTSPTLTISVAPAKPAIPQVPAALVLVNGKKQVLRLGATFPAKHPMFKVLALSQKAVWLQLVGGSLASGSQTLKLDAGRKVLLQNTTAGVKIALKLVRATTAPAPATTPAR